MNFYWFGRTKDNNLSEMSKELEDAGFYGILLPYAVDVGDYFIQVATSIKNDQKLKYIIAIRPYTISPQHLAMIIKSLNVVASDRLWINFVSGQILDDEKEIGGIIGDINDKSLPEDRRKYLQEYVPIFYDLCKKLNIKSTICISGMGPDTFSLVEKYGDYNFVAHQAYVDSGPFKKISKPRVVSMFPLIKTQDEVDKLKESKTIPSDIFITTEDELIKNINNLKINGIDDVMFYCYYSEKDRDSIISFVKKNKDIFNK
jgi:hypothetical protein